MTTYPEYKPGSYKVGDIVSYGGYLWRAIKNTKQHPTNPGHWELYTAACPDVTSITII